MALVYHPTHRRNDLKKKNGTGTGKYVNHFIFLNVSTTNESCYGRIHKHKYKNLDLTDQNLTKKEIFDSRRRRNICKNTYKLLILKTCKNFFLEIYRTISV